MSTTSNTPPSSAEQLLANIRDRIKQLEKQSPETNGEPLPGSARSRAMQRWGLLAAAPFVGAAAWLLRDRLHWISAAGLAATAAIVIGLLFTPSGDRPKSPDVALPVTPQPGMTSSNPPPAIPTVPTMTPNQERTDMKTIPTTTNRPTPDRPGVPAAPVPAAPIGFDLAPTSAVSPTLAPISTTSTSPTTTLPSTSTPATKPRCIIQVDVHPLLEICLPRRR